MGRKGDEWKEGDEEREERKMKGEEKESNRKMYEKIRKEGRRKTVKNKGR